jgi:hypothetical protein
VEAVMVVGGVLLTWRQFRVAIELCAILPVMVPYRRSERITAVLAAGEDPVTGITPNDVKCWDSGASRHSLVRALAAEFRARVKPTALTMAKIEAANASSLRAAPCPAGVALPTHIKYDPAGVASCPKCNGPVHMGWQHRATTHALLCLQDLTSIALEVISGQCTRCKLMFEHGMTIHYLLLGGGDMAEGLSEAGDVEAAVGNVAADPLGPVAARVTTHRSNAWNSFSRGREPAEAIAAWSRMSGADKEGGQSACPQYQCARSTSVQYECAVRVCSSRSECSPATTGAAVTNTAATTSSLSLCLSLSLLSLCLPLLSLSASVLRPPSSLLPPPSVSSPPVPCRVGNSGQRRAGRVDCRSSRMVDPLSRAGRSAAEDAGAPTAVHQDRRRAAHQPSAHSHSCFSAPNRHSI